MVEYLRTFINQERGRFDTRHNNLFAFAFGEIFTYREFLEIIHSRCNAVGVEYKALSLAQMESVSRRQPGPLTVTEQAVFVRTGELQILVRLEIETFYLFATILLDRVAAAVAFYFDGESSTSWGRHSRMVKLFAGFADRKQLVVPHRFNELMTGMENAVIAFRNRHVAHSRDLRAMRATAFGSDEMPRLAISNLYPTAGDTQADSRPLDDLLRVIDAYLTAVIEMVVLNRDRTGLILAAH